MVQNLWSWGCQRYGIKSWEPFQGSLIVKHVFSTNIGGDDMTHFSLFFEFPFFNYPSLPKAAQPDYGMINMIIWFVSRRKNNR